MLIVEDGTGLENAESYVSVADATNILSKYIASPNWLSATEEEKEQALRYATLWLDNSFSWYSTITKTENALGTTSQALGWPRMAYYTADNRYIADNSVPTKIKEATSLLASEHLSKPLDTQEDSIKSESIGSASVSYSGSSGKRRFSFLKLMLRDYGSAGKAKSATIWRA